MQERCQLCGRVFHEYLVDGRRIVFRGVCPEDRDKLIEFYRKLSAETIYTRFFSIIRYFDPYVDQLLSSSRALVVVAEDAGTGEIVGIAELIVEKDGKAEGGIIVLESMQGKGIGTQLALAMKRVAIEHGVRAVYGYILPDNVKALRLVRKLGGRVKSHYPSMLFVEIPIRNGEDGVEGGSC